MSSWTHNWIDDAAVYSEALSNPYHRHRLQVVDALTPAELKRPGKHVLDYGCGDGVLMQMLGRVGVRMTGFDISHTLVDEAEKRLSGAGIRDYQLTCGGCELLAAVPESSVDGVLCLNVLAYMDANETETFYRETRRILKPGGHLIATHSNELFDMFSCNGFTYEFFCKHLVDSRHHEPLKTQFPDLAKARSGRNTDVVPQTANFKNRENPLSYPEKLKRLGFTETRREFINHHAAPPRFLDYDNYIDTLDWPVDERWKLMFVCSTYGSCAVVEK